LSVNQHSSSYKMSLPPTYVKGFHDETAIRKMKYRPLGKTGLLVSEISLGSGPFGGNLYGAITQEEVTNIVTNALKAGVNYIDTAVFYGYGRSEEVLGNALKTIPRQAYYLATKACRYEDLFEYSAKTTRESIQNSLKRLQVDYVDIIQIHDVEFAPSEDIVLNETLPVLREFVEAGKAKFIGITGYALSTIASIAQKSKIPIQTILVFCRCGLLDRALQKYEEQFCNLGIGILNAAPVCLGLLLIMDLLLGILLVMKLRQHAKKQLNIANPKMFRSPV